tara:strand:+ start:59 stop:199 length:141 start_codon:yes stop_codon:yes gene_type:complete
VLLKDKEALEDAVAVDNKVILPVGTAEGNAVMLLKELLVCLTNAII